MIRTHTTKKFSVVVQFTQRLNSEIKALLKINLEI